MKRQTLVVTMSLSTIALIATGVVAATKLKKTEKAALNSNAQIQLNDPESKAMLLAKVRPVNVRVEKTAKERMTQVVTASGATSAWTDVTLSAETSGRIEYLGVALGQQVKKGQLLARVDYQTQKAQKQQAQANFLLAQATYNRLLVLGDGIITRQKLDEARYQLTTARAALDIALNNLKKSIVRSSINGVISAKHVDKGEYVGPGTKMFQVVDLSTIVVEAQVPETSVAQVAPKTKVTVAVDALKEQFEGTVDAILPAADPVSKTFTVRVKIENTELGILAGMSAQLQIEAHTFNDVLVVNQDTIVESAHSRSVFVAKEGIAKKRNVRLGSTHNDRVIILEGLESGENLVVLGHRGLKDGQPIHVVQ